MTKVLTIVVFLCLCSQVFAVNAIEIKVKDSTAAVADSSTFAFNPLFLGGGFWWDELTFVVRADGGTCYLVIEHEYDPGSATRVWLSSMGKGGHKPGETVELYAWDLPDSIALTAGTATTIVDNYVYLTYNGGSPALKRHATPDQIGEIGNLLDSMIFVGAVGLGAVSGSDEQIRYFNCDQPSLYKQVLRTTLHGHEVKYHSGIGITAEEGAHTIALTRGFLYSGTDNILVPATTTDNALLYVPVYFDSNYARWDSLDNFAEYSNGDPIGNNYFWVVIWGAISKDTTEYKLYMNIQDGATKYNTLAQAQQDQDNMIPTAIPEEFHETGFLIAGLIIRGSNDEIQLVSSDKAFVDMREFISGAGGGSGGVHTDSGQVDAWDFMLRAEFDDSLDAADYLDSTNIANQGLVPEDLDTTDNDFVFSNVFRGMSSQAESVFVTIETIEDSLALAGRVAGQVWTGVHDYGGATSLEIPNAADPTTDAEGEIAWDSDDHWIEGFDNSVSRAIPTVVCKAAHIEQPDNIVGFRPMIDVDDDDQLAPGGIQIVKLKFELPADAADTVVFWEKSEGTDSLDFVSVIDSFGTTASEYFAEDVSPADGAIAAGNRVCFHLGATDVAWITIYVWYYVKDNN